MVPRVFPNVELPDVGAMPCGDVGALLEQTLVTWEDLRWMHDAWKGPIVVKGVHTGDDARRAIDAGARAVVVSNHGGRQLDGVAASLRSLPEVVAAVNSQVEVLMDGGIRRGGDIVKALCLGARAVLVGRAYAWGLARPVAPVSRVQSRSWGRTSCARCDCSDVMRWRSSIVPTSTCRAIGNRRPGPVLWTRRV